VGKVVTSALKIFPVDALLAEAGERKTLIFLMCCHNRRRTTLASLAGILRLCGEDSVAASVVLVDDGSSDGTSDAISGLYPQVTLVAAGGPLFWSGAMALAQARALELCRPDFLCWLNDDVELDSDAVRCLLALSARREDRSPVVGSLLDRETAALTYSGYRRGSSSRPKDLIHVVPDGTEKVVATFNGNLVLIPRAVYEALGTVDSAYAHDCGDLDYGFRAARAGFAPILAEWPLGFCTRNSVRGSWRDPDLALRRRLAALISPKGIHPRSNLVLYKRHGGPLWAAWLLGSYAKALSHILQTRARRSAVIAYVMGRL